MLRVVSWNILADSYVQPAYFPRSPVELLRKGARTQPILAWIAADPAGVFCLQEVEPVFVDAARAGLPGWTVRFEQKRGRPDGVAILARPGVALDNVAAIAFADGAPDREDSGHVALLATVAVAGLRVRIACTHVRWDPPGTPPEARWATRQVPELLAQLRGPALLCGDLNLTPDDAVYAAITTAGFVDPHARGARPTANPNGHAKRIDYTLVRADLRAVGIPPMPLDDVTPLPSDTMPSDHVPIAIELGA